MRSKTEDSDVFNSRDETYLVFTEKKIFSFYFIHSIGYMQCLKGGAENAKNEKF